jgi:hypothetical protein
MELTAAEPTAPSARSTLMRIARGFPLAMFAQSEEKPAEVTALRRGTREEIWRSHNYWNDVLKTQALP